MTAMHMQEVFIKDEFIKLGQALKLAGLVDSGLDAKIEITDGHVLVNGEKEDRRGRKLYDGDEVTYDGTSFVVRSPEKKDGQI